MSDGMLALTYVLAAYALIGLIYLIYKLSRRKPVKKKKSEQLKDHRLASFIVTGERGDYEFDLKLVEHYGMRINLISQAFKTVDLELRDYKNDLEATIERAVDIAQTFVRNHEIDLTEEEAEEEKRRYILGRFNNQRFDAHEQNFPKN